MVENINNFNKIRNLSSQRDNQFPDFFKFDDKFENGRKIFEDYDSCIWWHRPSRRWHLGKCEDLGTDTSLAYVTTDAQCPNLEGTVWKHVESNKTFDAKNIAEVANCEIPPPPCENCAAAASAVGTRIENTTAFGGVNVITKGSIFRQILRGKPCKWRISNLQWRCVQNTEKNRLV